MRKNRIASRLIDKKLEKSAIPQVVKDKLIEIALGVLKSFAISFSAALIQKLFSTSEEEQKQEEQEIVQADSFDSLSSDIQQKMIESFKEVVPQEEVNKIADSMKVTNIDSEQIYNEVAKLFINQIMNQYHQQGTITTASSDKKGMERDAFAFAIPVAVEALQSAFLIGLCTGAGKVIGEELLGFVVDEFHKYCEANPDKVEELKSEIASATDFDTLGENAKAFFENMFSNIGGLDSINQYIQENAPALLTSGDDSTLNTIIDGAKEMFFEQSLSTVQNDLATEAVSPQA